MTRHTEPAFTAAVRRAARGGDPTLSLSSRLDLEARFHGFGTWSALLASDPTHTPNDCPEPYAWRTDITRYRNSYERTGDEGDMLRCIVYSLAACIRNMDLFEEPGEGRDFEAYAAIPRMSRIRTGHTFWSVHFPYHQDGEFDNDAYEATFTRGRALGPRLLKGTRHAMFYHWIFMAWPTIVAEFHSPVVFLEVRDGRIHRVGLRLVQHGGVTWEARLDQGFSVIVTVDRERHDQEPTNLQDALTLLASSAPNGVCPSDFGLVPFAPAIRRREGLWPHGLGHAYENQGTDMGRIRGVVCRLRNSERTMWRARGDDITGYRTGDEPDEPPLA